MVEQAGRLAIRTGRYVLCLLAAVLVTACNDGGSSGTASRGTTGPAISGTPAVVASVGQVYSFTPAVNGATVAGAQPRIARIGSGIGFSIANKPAWATFNVATGQLTGTPAGSDVGSYPGITISASNGTGSASLPAFTITVGQGGVVALNWQAPTTNTDGTPITNLAGYTINYGSSASSLNQTVTVDSPATTAYTVQNLTAGTWYFALSAYTSTGVKSSLTGVLSTTVQ